MYSHRYCEIQFLNNSEVMNHVTSLQEINCIYKYIKLFAFKLKRTYYNLHNEYYKKKIFFNNNLHDFVIRDRIFLIKENDADINSTSITNK